MQNQTEPSDEKPLLDTIPIVSVPVDEEWLRQAVFVCEIAIENTSECLVNNRHKRLEPLYKKDMEYAKKLRALLREKLGWPIAESIQA